MTASRVEAQVFEELPTGGVWVTTASEVAAAEAAATLGTVYRTRTVTDWVEQRP